MDPSFRYAIADKTLQLIYLFNSPFFTSQLGMTLEEVIDYVGYHSIRLQSETDDETLQCDICNHRCRLSKDEYGKCYAVANVNDTLISTNYGLITGTRTSNIEEFSLLHYRPASKMLMISSLFCNMRCDFCSNAPYTHIKSMYRQLLNSLVKYHSKPIDIVNMAKKEKVSGIVFSGNEPTVNLDFVLDVASLARQNNLFVAFQTNGYMTPEAIELLASSIDAIAIGIKGFSDVEIYDKRLREQGVEHEHILDSVRMFHERGVHTEVTALVLKSGNVEESVRQTSKWLATCVSREIPIDIFRMAPYYQSLWREEDWLTSDEVADIASICRDSGLLYVYDRCEPHDLATYCSNCGKIVVQRTARGGELRCSSDGITAVSQPEYEVHYVGLNVVEGKGYCANCGSAIYGVWK